MTTRDSSTIEKHITVTSDGPTAVDLLHEASGFSKQQIKQAMQKGAVWITRSNRTQRLRRAKRQLQKNDEIHLYYDERILAELAAEPELIADKGEYSVWNKPYGLRSQGSKWGDHCTVVRWAERNLRPERSAFTVHRLDRAANGLILIAHTKKTAAAFAKLFQDREIEKRYRAIVVGDFSTRERPLRIDDSIDGKVATTECTFLRPGNDSQHSVLDVKIETGRKHQIRRHLADLGYPVVGDRLYGRGAGDGMDLQLTANYLSFRCPVEEVPVEYRLTTP